MASTIKRTRKKALSSLRLRQQFDFDFPDELTLFVDRTQFLLYDSGPDDTKVTFSGRVVSALLNDIPALAHPRPR